VVSDISNYRTSLIVSALAFSVALFLVIDLPETRDLKNRSGSTPRIGEEPL